MRKVLFILMPVLVVSMFMASPVHSGITILYVSPPSIVDTSKVAGTKFTVDINIKDVTYLYSFDFTLNYAATILTGPPPLEIIPGSFFPSGSMVWKNVTDDALGYVRYILGLAPGTQEGVSGSGTLATIEFTVDSIGSSPLILSNTLLSEFRPGWTSGRPVAHTVYNGYFTNRPEQPKLDVSPEAQSIINPELIPGKNFTINVNVSNASDVYSSEFKQSYNPELLDVVSISEGDFLKSFGSTSFLLVVNETEGFVWVSVTLQGATVGVGGDGVLAKITFNVTDIGDCTLHLYDTKLIDSEGTPIEHYTADGYFSNRPTVHDLIVTKVATIVTTVKVEQGVTVPVTTPVSEAHAGDHVNVTVTVKNNGTVTETFDVTAYHNTTAIGSNSGIILSEGASKTLTIEWKTAGVPAGNWTIWAEVSTIPEEINTDNNKLIKEGMFRVLSPENSIPIELVAVAVAVIAVATIVAVYFLKIRKPKASRTES